MENLFLGEVVGRAGRRGYGGGFHDRMLEALPLEPTDQPLDAIVTDAYTLTF